MAKVTKIYATRFDAGDAGQEGHDVVHIEGVSLIGSDTLCGHVDRIDMTFEETTRAVTCKGCLAVWNFVKKGQL